MGEESLCDELRASAQEVNWMHYCQMSNIIRSICIYNKFLVHYSYHESTN